MRLLTALCAGVVCAASMTISGATTAAERAAAVFHTPGGGVFLFDGRAVRVHVTASQDFMPPLIGAPPTTVVVSLTSLDSRGLSPTISIREAEVFFARSVWRPRFFGDIRAAIMPNPNGRYFIAQGGPGWPTGARIGLKLTLTDGRVTRRIEVPVILGRLD